jgi:predicted metalloprotease with PDZ domain
MTMIKNRDCRLLFFTLALIFTSSGEAVCSSRPLDYRILINPTDPSGYDIEIRIPDAKGTVRLAMAAHPEYDDRYFRYIENFSAESGGRKVGFTKPEDAIWQLEGVRGGLTVQYRIVPAPKEREWRQTWKPFLTPTAEWSAIFTC